MKHVFLSIAVCLFLFTSCFEKEEIAEQEQLIKEKEKEGEEVVNNLPSKDSVECYRIKLFIDSKRNLPPTNPPASVKKYRKGDDYVYQIFTGGASYQNSFSITGYTSSNCEFICSDAPSCVSYEHYCSQSFIDSLIYVETIWERRDTL